MTTEKWLKLAQHQLAKAGITTARLDALVLLENRLGVDRARLLAHPEMELSESDENVLNAQITRRIEHIPLAYVLGKTEFYGRDFIITPAVLEPRPESETMIDLLKELVRTALEFETHLRGSKANKKTGGQTAEIRIADVGTGSGALGITAALELPNVSVDLLELDDQALEVAKSNVVPHTIAINALQSDLLKQSPQDYDILLCNLPYVPDDFQINLAAMHEPRLAIFGGPDGLDLYRRLFAEIQILQQKPLYILTEALPPQHNALTDIANAHSYTLMQTEDFIQVFRQHSSEAK